MSESEEESQSESDSESDTTVGEFQVADDGILYCQVRAMKRAQRSVRQALSTAQFEELLVQAGEPRVLPIVARSLVRNRPSVSVKLYAYIFGFLPLLRISAEALAALQGIAESVAVRIVYDAPPIAVQRGSLCLWPIDIQTATRCRFRLHGLKLQEPMFSQPQGQCMCHFAPPLYPVLPVGFSTLIFRGGGMWRTEAALYALAKAMVAFCQVFLGLARGVNALEQERLWGIFCAAENVIRVGEAEAKSNNSDVVASARTDLQSDGVIVDNRACRDSKLFVTLTEIRRTAERLSLKFYGRNTPTDIKDIVTYTGLTGTVDDVVPAVLQTFCPQCLREVLCELEYQSSSSFPLRMMILAEDRLQEDGRRSGRNPPKQRPVTAWMKSLPRRRRFSFCEALKHLYIKSFLSSEIKELARPLVRSTIRVCKHRRKTRSQRVTYQDVLYILSSYRMPLNLNSHSADEPCALVEEAHVRIAHLLEGRRGVPMFSTMRPAARCEGVKPDKALRMVVIQLYEECLGSVEARVKRVERRAVELLAWVLERHIEMAMSGAEASRAALPFSRLRPLSEARLFMHIFSKRCWEWRPYPDRIV